MLLIKLWNYLRGYVIIKISGEYCERLLNQAALNGLYLWDITKPENNVLFAKIGIKDFTRLARFAKKTGCRLVIVGRAGLFFSILKLKKRKILLTGAALFILAVYLLSSLVWGIEVKTDDNKLKSSIKRDLMNWGIKKGTFKHRIDKEYYLDKILIKYKEIAWAELQIKGSQVIVELVKKQMPPELEQNEPCDIIASKDGIIEEILPFKGEAMVKPGDTVSRGDIIISGRLTLKSNDLDEEKKEEQQEVLVHAKGIVRARVWYQKVVKVPLVKKEKFPTGNTKKAYRINVGNRALRFQLGAIPYSLYDKKVTRKIQLLPKIFGDVGLSSITYIELEEKERFIGMKEAIKQAEEQLEQEINKLESDAKINKRSIDFTLDNDKKHVIGSLTLEVLEDIGLQRQIK